MSFAEYNEEDIGKQGAHPIRRYIPSFISLDFCLFSSVCFLLFLTYLSRISQPPHKQMDGATHHEMQAFLDSILRKQTATTQIPGLAGRANIQVADDTHQMTKAKANIKPGSDSYQDPNGSDEDEDHHVVQHTIHHAHALPRHSLPITPLPHPQNINLNFNISPHPPQAKFSYPSYFTQSSPSSSTYPSFHATTARQTSYTLTNSNSDPTSSNLSHTISHSIPLAASSLSHTKTHQKIGLEESNKRRKMENESESSIISPLEAIEVDVEDSGARDMVHKLSEKNRRDRLR